MSEYAICALIFLILSHITSFGVMATKNSIEILFFIFEVSY